MNAAFRVTLASGLGGLIGSLVALQMNPYLWWIGLPVGSLTGYLTYDWQHVVSASREAWQQMGARREAKRQERIRTRLRRHRLRKFRLYAWLKFLPWTTLAGAILSFYMFAAGAILFAIFGLAGLSFSVGVIIYGFTFGIVWLAMGMMIFIVLSDYGIGRTVNGYRSKCSASQCIREDYRDLKKFIFWRNPLALLFYWIPVGIHASFKPTCKFIKLVFIEIHSHARLLCATDAAIGTTIGYFTGNALMGLAVGAFAGLLDYAVVSRWWLKLEPNGN